MMGAFDSLLEDLRAIEEYEDQRENHEREMEYRRYAEQAEAELDREVERGPE